MTSAWLKALSFLSIVFLVIIGATLVDYASLLLEAGENKRLKAENLHLKQQFRVVESKLTSLESSLDRVKSFSKKLRLITKIDDDDRTVTLAGMAEERPGESLGEFEQKDWWKREPSSEFMKKDLEVFKRPILQAARDELSVEAQRDYASLAVRIDKVVKEARLREQSVLELRQLLADRMSLLNATPSLKPSRGWYTSRFGYRIDPFTGKATMHNGLDVAAPPGTPIYAPADGVVSYVGFESGYGKLVSIDHGYGVVTRFGHTSRTFVTVGQKIRRKDVIAAVGATGRASGPHLHYEVRVHGVPVDPSNYILNE